MRDSELLDQRWSWQRGATPEYWISFGRTGVDTAGYDTLSFRLGSTLQDDRLPFPNAIAAPVIVLKDVAGATARVANAFYTYFDKHGPYENRRTMAAATVLDSFRIPLQNFSGINLKKLTSMTVVLDGTKTSTVALTDVHVTRAINWSAGPQPAAGRR